MGRSMKNCVTQAKERARQQKQTDKALKRILHRQKKAYAKTSTPVPADTAEPFIVQTVECAD